MRSGCGSEGCDDRSSDHSLNIEILKGEAEEIMVSAIDYWKQRVNGHNLQSTRAEGKSLWASSDFWRPLMSNFAVDPHRTDDPGLNRVLTEVNSDSTVIDVGGGAGRFGCVYVLRHTRRNHKRIQIGVGKPEPEKLEDD